MEIEKEINKDLILREKLAVQRTIMANQTTFLSFLRTAMYFLVAINYFIQRKKIEEGKRHIGDYKLEYQNKK